QGAAAASHGAVSETLPGVTWTMSMTMSVNHEKLNPRRSWTPRCSKVARDLVKKHLKAQWREYLTGERLVLTAEEVAKRTALTVGDVAAVLESLERSEWLCALGGGRYTMTAHGRERCDVVFVGEWVKRRKKLS